MSARDDAINTIKRICPSHLDAEYYGAVLAERFDAYRAKVLREAADKLDDEQNRLDDEANERHGWLDHDAEIRHYHGHRLTKMIRRMADEEKTDER